MAASPLKQLLFGQYVASGAQVSVGVGLVALGLYWVSGQSFALTAASGAVCVSIVDYPGPMRLKAVQLGCAALFTTLVTLLISYTHLDPVAEFLTVVCVSAAAGLLNAYGKKAIALSFVCIYAFIIGIGSARMKAGGQIAHALNFGLGALLYAAYALISSRVLLYRTKQQALAEALFELARYLETKAHFFERDADLNVCYGDLVAAQVDLIDKQQAARDLIFRQLHRARHVHLAQILISTVDLYEQVFSSHTDYGLIHTHFRDADVVMLLRDLANKAAVDLRRIGYAILRGREAPHAVIYKAEMIAINHELERLEVELEGVESRAALTALEAVYRRLERAIVLIGAMHEMVRSEARASHLPQGVELVAFVSPLTFSWRVIKAELRRDSPVCRFAIRLTLAMGCGWLLAYVLPYATHSYWILLTVAVILRANYSVTRQRRNDRILGTLLGCIFVAALLHLHPSIGIEVLVLLFALGWAHAFATLIYRYTAAAACVMAVLQVHFLNPGAPFAISERLIDTLVGAAIAFAFSFVLPSWEHLAINRQVRALLDAHGRFARATLDPLTPDGQYRLARKQLFDTIALTSAMFRRMLLEPRGQQRAVAELNDFITSSYTFASQMVAVRSAIEHPAAEDLAFSADDARRAAEWFEALFCQSARAGAPIEAESDATPSMQAAQIQARMRDLRHDAQRLIALAGAIAPAVGQKPERLPLLPRRMGSPT